MLHLPFTDVCVHLFAKGSEADRNAPFRPSLPAAIYITVGMLSVSREALSFIIAG